MPTTAKPHSNAFVPPAPPFTNESVTDDMGHVYMKHIVPDAVRREAATTLLDHLRHAPMPAGGKSGAELLREAREERARRYGV